MTDTFSPRQQRAIDEYLRCGVQSDAYRVAYDCSRMKDATINNNAYKFFSGEKVAREVKRRQAQLAERSVFGVLDVLKEWMDIGTADPSKLQRVRHLNCRYCNGHDHHYQWRDKAEYAIAVAEAIDINAARAQMKPKKQPLELPNDKGGYGWAFNGVPHPGCPQCRGEGEEDVFTADIEKLTGKERKLFKGIKRTKAGVEILMRDQDGAINNIAKALGMLTEKVKLVDPNEKTDLPPVPLDPVEAARVYQALVKGDPT